MMDTFMALLLAMFAAMPGNVAHRKPDPAAAVAPQPLVTKERAKLSEHRDKLKSCTQQAKDRDLKGYARVDFIAACVEA